MCLLYFCHTWGIFNPGRETKPAESAVSIVNPRFSGFVLPKWNLQPVSFDSAISANEMFLVVEFGRWEVWLIFVGGVLVLCDVPHADKLSRTENIKNPHLAENHAAQKSTHRKKPRGAKIHTAKKSTQRKNPRGAIIHATQKSTRRKNQRGAKIHTAHKSKRRNKKHRAEIRQNLYCAEMSKSPHEAVILELEYNYGAVQVQFQHIDSATAAQLQYSCGACRRSGNQRASAWSPGTGRMNTP